MKIQVRQGVFETNSSSTHSLSVFSESDWKRFENGEMLIKGFPYESELVDIKNVDPSDIYDPENEDQYWEEYEYFTYDVFCELEYETIFKTVGNNIVMSVYGSRC